MLVGQLEMVPTVGDDDVSVGVGEDSVGVRVVVLRRRVVRERDAESARKLIEENRRAVPAAEDEETAEMDVIEKPKQL